MVLLFFQLFAVGLLESYQGSSHQKPCSDTSFSYRVVSGTRNSIEVVKSGPESATYTLKLYRISGDIELVATKENVYSTNSRFDELPVADYLVLVSWGSGCRETLGGVEGIKISN